MPFVSNTLICDLNVTGLHNVRLAVWESINHPGEWHWEMGVDSGRLVLARGVTESQLAAQIASQLAHETWLYSKHKDPNVVWNGPYNWQLKKQD